MKILPPRLRATPGRYTFAFFVGLVPVLPPLVLAYISFHALGMAAMGVCLVFLGLGVSVQERPAWVRGIAVPYWLLVITAQIPFALFGFQTSPTFFFIALALALTAFLPIPWQRLRRWILVVFVAILGVASAWELWAWSHAASLLAAVFAIVGPMLTLFLARRGVFTAVNRTAVALCVFTALFYTKGYLVYGTHKPLAINRILQQPGVRAVYDYRKPPFDKGFPTRTMFMAPVPGYDMYVVGPHDPYREVLRIEPGAPPIVSRLSIGARGGDQALFHKDTPGAFVMAGRSHLYRIGVDPLRILDEANLGEKKLPLNMVRYDPLNNRYFVIRAYHREAYVVDRASFRLVKTMKAPPYSCYTDGWVDPTGNALILLGDYLPGGQVELYDLTTLALRKKIHLPWDPLTLGVLDDRGRRLYIASLIRRSILVFDLDTLEPQGRLEAEYGIRNLNFDPQRRWLIAGNFFNGDLLVYDADTKQLIGKLFLGKQVRWVEVVPENGKWYVNSSAGGFEIEPDMAFAPGPPHTRARLKALSSLTGENFRLPSVR